MNYLKKMKLPQYIFGFRVSSLMEALLLLFTITAIDHFFLEGDRFLFQQLHPYYFVVLLITVQYGTVEGITATLLATLFLYVNNFPEQKVSESMFDYQYRIAAQPLLWFASSFIFGEIRMRLEYKNKALQEEIVTYRNQANTITDEYQQLKITKENMEARLASQQNTVTNTYKALKSLETLKPTHVLTNLEGIIQGTLKVNKFSIFSVGEAGLEIVKAVGWKESDSYNLRINQEKPLFWEIFGEHRMICVVNEEEEKVLDGEGMLASPLIDNESQEVFGMLKIEELEFIDLNVSTIATFQQVCELIGMAYSNAKRHKEAVEQTITTDISGLFSDSYLQEQKSYLLHLCQKIPIPLSQIELNIRPLKKEAQSFTKLINTIQNSIPSTAQLYYGDKRKTNLLILLPNTSTKAAEKLGQEIIQEVLKNEVFKEVKIKLQIEELFKVNMEKRVSS